MGTSVNSEYPDEMQHDNAAFHQGLHCLLRLKQPLRTKKRNFRNLDLWPLKIQNGQSHTYLINTFGKIPQNPKG